MSYYLRDFPGLGMQLWQIIDDVAVLVGVSNAEQGAGTYFKAGPGEDIWGAIKRQAPGWFGPNGESPFHQTMLSPGKFYPRIARPTDGAGSEPTADTEPNIVAAARGQLSALTRQLARICQTVQPQGCALNAFGHDIRNLLILACTEVETHWRGVLVANGAAGASGRLSTAQYVQLRAPMKLDEYAVTLSNYPWLPAFRPYDGWGSTGKPTQELAWYDAYNAVKHDRENEFERATLLRVLEAISACVIMIIAQFDLRAGLGNFELRSFFHLSAVPNWSPSEIYIFPRDPPADEWSSVNFDFRL